MLPNWLAFVLLSLNRGYVSSFIVCILCLGLFVLFRFVCGFNFSLVYNETGLRPDTVVILLAHIRLHRAQLVLGWVTICEQINHLGM